MKKTFLVSAFALVLAACASMADVSGAASKVAALWKAESYSTGFSKDANTDTGAHSAITLTLENLHAVDSSYSHDKVTSVSAMTMLDNMKEQDYSGYDQLKIEVKDKSASYEQTYDIARLKNTKALIQNTVDTYFKMAEKKDLAGMKPLFDEKLVSDSMLVNLLNASEKLDAENGKTSQHTITGFSYNSTKDDNKPVICVTLQTKNGNTDNNYLFYILEDTKKIIYIGLNQ